MRITLLNHEKIEKYKDPCFGAEGGDQLNLTGLFFLFKWHCDNVDYHSSRTNS